MIMPRKGLMVNAFIGVQRFDHQNNMGDTRVSDSFNAQILQYKKPDLTGFLSLYQIHSYLKNFI